MSVKRPFFLIAGPCVMENEELCNRVAGTMKEISGRLGIPYIFKVSFDKANRSSHDAFRGPGLEEGLQVMERIKVSHGLRVTTDIHESAQVPVAAKVIDLLQIPAFLCRQTDLLLAAAASGRAVNVKKGQFLAPEDMDNVAEKLKTGGCEDYYFTERGTTFGYHNLVVDMRGLATMKAAGHRVIFDATHSVQRPGGNGTSTGGDGFLAPMLARAAVAVGIDGLFIETHPDPARALSDGANMIPLAEMESLLRKLLDIHHVANS